MKKTMQILLILTGILIGLVLIVTIAGLFFPEKHKGIIAREFKQSPEEIWSLITNRSNELSRRTDLKNIEQLPDRNGNEVWKEKTHRGQTLITVTTEQVLNEKLVRKLVDHKWYGGTWIIELSKTKNGSKVLFTEHGEIYNPLICFMFNVVFSRTPTIVEYANQLSASLH
jgi:hypothetical protein